MRKIGIFILLILILTITFSCILPQELNNNFGDINKLYEKNKWNQGIYININSDRESSYSTSYYIESKEIDTKLNYPTIAISTGDKQNLLTIEQDSNTLKLINNSNEKLYGKVFVICKNNVESIKDLLDRYDPLHHTLTNHTL